MSLALVEGFVVFGLVLSFLLFFVLICSCFAPRRLQMYHINPTMWFMFIMLCYFILNYIYSFYVYNIFLRTMEMYFSHEPIICDYDIILMYMHHCTVVMQFETFLLCNEGLDSNKCMLYIYIYSPQIYLKLLG